MFQILWSPWTYRCGQRTKVWAVGSLVVRASDSRPEGLGSMPDATKHPPSTHGSRCRNCGGGDRGRVAIYRPFGELRRAKIVLSPVWCSRPTTGVPLAHATMNFVGLDLTASDRLAKGKVVSDSILTSLYSATRGLLEMDLVIKNHSQGKRMTPEPAPPLLTSTPMGGRLSFDIFNENRPSSAWRVFSGTRLELLTRRPRVRDLDY
ncbi:hypothetical protein TNCV_1186581 [Trichonephila clavipes]|nr:hypothetical protein TNCV_1186581 [Trichonephila clavipes]